ncbi:hypothetical protein M422DRAFT_53196 [Sphaerobolus stellatus SS14]|uniref:Uncharacterized protein n=1 Tax=Sphaerobolus stellatus (strain SS14) TaxID=990650 RepID=A0A0C9V2S1_SPHS4|nr:hypothetical protein M422DRAFT_53196 [Sphaerobolus stellatus SS14]
MSREVAYSHSSIRPHTILNTDDITIPPDVSREEIEDARGLLAKFSPSTRLNEHGINMSCRWWLRGRRLPAAKVQEEAEKMRQEQARQAKHAQRLVEDQSQKGVKAAPGTPYDTNGQTEEDSEDNSAEDEPEDISLVGMAGNKNNSCNWKEKLFEYIQISHARNVPLLLTIVNVCCSFMMMPATVDTWTPLSGELITIRLKQKEVDIERKRKKEARQKEAGHASVSRKAGGKGTKHKFTTSNAVEDSDQLDHVGLVQEKSQQPDQLEGTSKQNPHPSETVTSLKQKPENASKVVLPVLPAKGSSSHAKKQSKGDRFESVNDIKAQLSDTAILIHKDIAGITSAIVGLDAALKTLVDRLADQENNCGDIELNGPGADDGEQGQEMDEQGDEDKQEVEYQGSEREVKNGDL